jgi:hypothetical protein
MEPRTFLASASGYTCRLHLEERVSEPVGPILFKA